MRAVSLLLLLAVTVDRTRAFAPSSRQRQQCWSVEPIRRRTTDRTTTTSRVSIGASIRDNHDFDVDAARRQLESLLEAGVTSSSSSSPRAEGRADSWPSSSSSSAAVEASTTTAGGGPLFVADKSIEGDALDFLQKVADAVDLDVQQSDIPSLSRPVLTSMDRARRLAELRLLSELAPASEDDTSRGGEQDHDQVLSELWNLWFHERGPAAAAKIMKAEELVAQGPRQWGVAESMLKDLVLEYGMAWAEPMNRLATLYYLQRKYRAAERLCLAVLAIKPWHFGALSGIVLVYEGLRDSDSAQKWAARRLPTYSSTGSNKRRTTWVQQAIKNAEGSLLEAERSTSRAFGAPDHHTEKERRHQSREHVMESDDSWQ